ncbi:MAG: hypothetical protein UR28_C0029G0007 [Candidatus Peregrinibacteria bacterium GW2011_GWF2_33_10]|nr:MAG: hypothetical protein UR28_C0029G0007 [Candidatus Peregrinibacteria bacterium GW2011_GWF2_33_10]OGJ45440.1 MAG: hypothetical protein A2263_04200 [Candidatus Peregrinibacteria bacterium RIFOXYA2_FULL_33_21]OGJ46278.1 MAG: hypothetical protein A2272_03005 [Candidatus Peregrinibacteria bacterium RIFOXYA12_FULL_33_12]OGJ51044.1 MAG: hypothetical protein A2307_05800 [Candidatus Peregrinibacteria bacterium RIFOXYB2_FULL_33_20]
MSETLHGKTILILNTGPHEKRFILERLKELGLNLVVVNKTKNWAEDCIDHWVITDNEDHDRALQDIANFMKVHSEIKIGGVMTFWEHDVLLASKLVDKYGFKGISWKVANKVRNKYLFREFCGQHDIPAPKHKLITNEVDLKYVSENFTFPLVMKPTLGAASCWVVKIESQADLKKTFEFIKSNINSDEEKFIRESELFVEEYIDGNEVDMDILIQGGEIRYYSITDNFKTQEPYFVETGQIIPSILSKKRQNELFVMAKDTLSKLHITDGCMHFEAKSSEHGAVPIEVNLRMGGDEVWSFVKGAWGCDLVENAAKIALGIDMGEIKRGLKPLTYLMGKYFLPNKSGVLAYCNLDERVRQKKYLYDLQLFWKKGDKVMAPPDGYDYLGWVTVKGDNAQEAESNMQDAFNHLSYKII